MENKYGVLFFKIISALFVVAVAACVIVDFAVNRRLVWAGYPVASIVFVWVLMMPLFFAKRNKALLSLAMLTVAVIPFLFFLDRLTPGRSWFAQLGIPIAVCSVLVFWATYAASRYIKVNPKIPLKILPTQALTR